MMTRTAQGVRRMTASAVIAVVASSGTGLAAPGDGTIVLAGPEGTAVGYATPYAVSPQSKPVTFVNADPLAAHNVNSTLTVAVRVKDGRKTRIVRKPLFFSPVIAAGGNATIAGTASLKAGTYTFYCAVHPSMRGSLVVV